MNWNLASLTQNRIETDEELEEAFFNEINFCAARKVELENGK